MNSNRPFRPHRGEAVVRSTLAFALLAAVAWAVLGGQGSPGF
jgi:23S rRNA G2445 N2-methylase RlmL